MASRRPLYKDNDLRIRLKKLRIIDAPTVPVEDADVDYTIYNVNEDGTDGDTFASGTLTLQGVDGWYWATIDRAVTAGVVIDANYRVQITAATPAGDEGTWSGDYYGTRR